MPRSGITVYLPRNLEERIEFMAKEQHRSASSLVAEAVKARFERRGGDDPQGARAGRAPRGGRFVGECGLRRGGLLRAGRHCVRHLRPGG